MEAAQLLSLCDQGQWPQINAALKQQLKQTPDSADAYAMAAHANLRTGHLKPARFLADKAISLEPQSAAAQAEDICLDFFEAEYERAWHKLHEALLEAVPDNHPLHRIARFLGALHGEEYPSAAVETVALVQADLKRGDKLLALLDARIGELAHPAEADSFAALGLANLYAGFYRNADRNFHEAIFRQTRYGDLVNLHHFYLFCRQHRFADALTIGFNIEKARKLEAHGQGLLLEMMLRHGVDITQIQERLKLLLEHLRARGQGSAVVEVVKLRMGILLGHVSSDQAIEILQPHVNRPDCPPPLLYFYAQLQSKAKPALAREAAARALALDALHPDAALWDEPAAREQINFEYAGMFIPTQHEGTAWPTKTQMQLLEILFSIPAQERGPAWEAFAHQQSLYSLEAGAYRLLPYLYKLLDDGTVTSGDMLKGIWKKAYVENALKAKHVLATIGGLEEAGVEVVLLKGLANATALYGDLGSRPMSDVDILIDVPMVERAHQFLTAQGWQTEEVPTPDRLRFAYAMTYRHPEGGMLDVHWYPCEAFCSHAFEPADLGEWDEITLLGGRYAVLSPTLNLFCTIFHGVEWNHLSPVRWVADALLIMRTQAIDWAEIYRLAEKYHCLPPIAMGLKFLEHFEDASAYLPPALKEAVEADYTDNTLMKIRLRPRTVIASFDEAWAMMEHMRARHHLNANDYPVICGGDDPKHFQAECQKRGITWVPRADKQAMLAAVATKKRDYNLIVIDANLSCTFQCLNVRVS